MPVVVNGAMCKCSFGTTPSALSVIPKSRVFASNAPIASISDFVPMVNIKPFGQCLTITNPVVAAATAAKLGVFTPVPCVPVVVAPWIPSKPTVLGVLHSEDMCMCTWGGIIKIMFPEQFTVL